ncbi:MAG: dihydrodipicolinate synthase family protein [bacterium]|jgi:dihydrodipicolinate synthase/N-acetylneuraminate lyase
MINRLQGVIPPLVTPFTEQGDLDEHRLRAVVNFVCPHVHGLFVCGTYGSGPLMTATERKRCLEVVLQEVNGQIPVIAHVGTTTSREALDLACHAASVGATAIASIPPYYYQHVEQEVQAYYSALLDAVQIPVYIYNNPKTVGYGVSVDLVGRLAERGITGIKESSFDLMLLGTYFRRVTTPGFDIVLGTEALLLPATTLGIQAFIPGLGNAFPELCNELWQACQERDYDRALDLQWRVNDLRDIMYSAGSTMVAVYELLRARGIDAGYPRRPFIPLAEEDRNQLRNRLRAIGVL